MIFWIGWANDHLYVVYKDGRTFRLDRELVGEEIGRKWTLVATLPE